MGHRRKHLLDIDENANNRVNLLIKQFTEIENVNEELKTTKQLEWVQSMNNIKNRAEEIVLNEFYMCRRKLDIMNFREVNEDDILKNGMIVWKKFTCVMQINKIEKMKSNLMVLARVF